MLLVPQHSPLQPHSKLRRRRSGAGSIAHSKGCFSFLPSLLPESECSWLGLSPSACQLRPQPFLSLRNRPPPRPGPPQLSSPRGISRGRDLILSQAQLLHNTRAVAGGGNALREGPRAHVQHHQVRLSQSTSHWDPHGNTDLPWGSLRDKPTEPQDVGFGKEVTNPRLGGCKQCLLPGQGVCKDE